ncbi:MAG: hypothetical protein NWE92_04265 [Candidatus Bathyarchaeota archaeon]|nr:hypothetical protein [Candidatus Bathyarchaeota archaeon]
MKQFLLTPSMGKRLIAKALTKHPAIQSTLKSGILVIIAGTTNGYLAQEILTQQGITDFSARRFFRGITPPPSNKKVGNEGRLIDESQFPGDVVLMKGEWQRGKTIADVVGSMREGDVIVKGANAVDLERHEAGVLIGHPKAGTVGLSLPAVVGRRVKLIVSVGLEKRVNLDMQTIAAKLNEPGASGYRFMPLIGEVFTELEAFKLLCGVDAELVAAGGVFGAEGACWIAISGTKEQEQAAAQVYASIADEPPFSLGKL